MKSLHILIAEDESLIRMGLKRILEDAGHTVSTAPDGMAALDQAEVRTPDIAILDIRMPRLDGLETAKQLYERSAIPIIFLTAFSDRELIERAALLPVMGYLVKPFKEAELLAMITVAVTRFGEHAQTAQNAAEANAALADHQLVERALGRIMQAEGVSEFEARSRLEERARKERRMLLEVARDECDAPGRNRIEPA